MRLPSLLKYELLNIFRGKWIVLYAVLLAAFSEVLLQFGSDSAKAVASLMSVTLLIAPLVSMLYSSIYWYNAESFTALLLTQPVHRDRIYLSRWVAISTVLSMGLVAGLSIPLAINEAFDGSTTLLLACGVILTFIFSALGLMTSVFVSDRMKGVGAVFMLWLYFAVVHDSLVFFIISAFHDYPMELPSMVLVGINPVDLVRVTLLMSLDFSALMGYTGVILQKHLSGILGYASIGVALVLWMSSSVIFGLRFFRKRDY